MTVSTIDRSKLALGEPAKAAARRSRAKLVIGLLVVVTVAGLGAAGWAGGKGLFGAAARHNELMSYEVQPMDLRVTVLESGTLESASSVKVLSEVEGRVAIIGLAPEGTRVGAGEIVVELDDSALRTRRTEQQIIVEKARAAHSKAIQDNTVAQSQAESDVKSAELALEFAGFDLRKYIEGDFPQELAIIEAEITLAEEELERAKVQLQFSEELFNEKYLSKGEVDIDRFQVMRNEIRLELAQNKKKTLEQYTFARTKRDLESKVAEAERALERVKKLATAAVEQAAGSLSAAAATLDLEEGKLRHVERQIERCQMRAPQAGVVVYPIPEDDDLVELYIREGTMVRERQHIFSIPDTDVLQVTTSIHEAMVNKVKPGMPARIWADVYPDMEIRGEVLNVSPVPDPEDWRRTTVKFYTTKVRLHEQMERLRPGMTVKVEILLDELEGVLATPVQSVVRRRDVGACYVYAGGRPEIRRLVLGESNETHVEVKEGLRPGDRVVLSPDVLGIPEHVIQQLGQAPGTAGAEQVAGAAPPVEDKQQVEFEAMLRGATGAVGEAQFETTTYASRPGVVEYEFEIKVTGGPPSATLEVVVDGVAIGSVTLDAVGSCDWEWATKDGNFPENFPPEVGAGTRVTVGGDALAGTLVP